MDTAEDAVVDRDHGFELIFRGSPEQVKKWLSDQPMISSAWAVVTGSGIKATFAVSEYLRR
jgi:hypothetical protein